MDNKKIMEDMADIMLNDTPLALRTHAQCINLLADVVEQDEKSFELFLELKIKRALEGTTEEHEANRVEAGKRLSQYSNARKIYKEFIDEYYGRDTE